MKKLTALVVISMFALAACQPANLVASGEDIAAAITPLEDVSIESEDSGDDGSDSSESEGSESSDSMEMESSSESGEMYSEDSSSQYMVDVSLENGISIPEQLTLHEGSTVTWTNNDTVSYTISIMKMDDSSDDSMDNSSDDSPDDESMDDSYAPVEFTVEPGQTVSFTLRDSGVYQFTIAGGTVSLSGMIYVSDSESDDSYDDMMDDSMDDSYDDSEDDMMDDSSDDSYDDSYDDSSDDGYDDSYDDDSDDNYDDSSDDYDDEEDDSEDEEDDHSYLFTVIS
ncbi:MAG: hypothetical protein H0S79_05695 [Anaerolineaceae bacterium]|nr:hypothetical protein [Anaerolineaceae bacterium]